MTVQPGPWRITFDTNPDDCNLHCIMCEDHSIYSKTQENRKQAGKARRRMDISLIRKVLDEAKGTPLREIIPSTMGEPLLYRNFDEIIELCREYGVKLNLTTNGTFPGKGAEKWARLIVPIASDVKISWNGATKETQEKIMIGTNWENVLANVKTFVRVRDELLEASECTCTVTFQLTFLEENVQELADIVKLAIDLGLDRVKGHHLWAHFQEIQPLSMRRNSNAIKRWNEAVIKAQAMAANHPLKNGKTITLENIYLLDDAATQSLLSDSICPFLGREAWINTEGKFGPCCAPDKLRESLGHFGHLTEKSMYDIWNSKEYKDLQKNYLQHKVCQSCNMRVQPEQLEKKMKLANWKETEISKEGTHHLHNHQPIYSKRFHHVQKYHAPGLAAVSDDTGAYHIDLQNNPLYPERYLKTFGFYAGLAAVESTKGCFHINSKGIPAYKQRYAWCGNFQEERCIVKDFNKRYLHIDGNGNAIYTETYDYAGDYKDGYAVAFKKGLGCTHIDSKGRYLHQKWFEDLDIFHKGVARAKDSSGCLHVNMQGEALYARRFAQVNPFYNGAAFVEAGDGSKLLIDQEGKTVEEISPPTTIPIYELSSDMVGFWKTETLSAAVELHVFDVLPGTNEAIAAKLKLPPEKMKRLLRALWEMNIVYLQDGVWHMTKKGLLLNPTTTAPMAAAATMWSSLNSQIWKALAVQIKNPEEKLHSSFKKLEPDPQRLKSYFNAVDGYAKNDFAAMDQIIDWSKHGTIICAGRAGAIILQNVLNKYSTINGILLDDEKYLYDIEIPVSLSSRFSLLAHQILNSWPQVADAICFPNTLHCWPDEDVRTIFHHAKQALAQGGKIYLITMLMHEEHPGGALLDLNMLVETGGKERTLGQWEKLSQQEGLKISNICPHLSIATILTLEAVS